MLRSPGGDTGHRLLGIAKEGSAVTADVEDILSAARSLPPYAQLEILRRLAESLAGAFSPLDAVSDAFWAPRTIEELAAERGTPVVTDLRALALPD
jgi:hypothetical protein